MRGEPEPCFRCGASARAGDRLTHPGLAGVVVVDAVGAGTILFTVERAGGRRHAGSCMGYARLTAAEFVRDRLAWLAEGAADADAGGNDWCI